MKQSLSNFSLLAALMQLSLNGKLSGLEAEVDQEGRKESTNMNIVCRGNIIIPSWLSTKNSKPEERAAQLAGSGGHAYIQTEVTDFVGGLYNKSVLTGLGARLITGLVGDFKLPASGGATAAWATEVAASSEGTPTVSGVNYTPKRLAAYASFSKMLLAQSGNPGVEFYITNEIVKAMNSVIEAAAIAGSGTNEPTGILNNGSVPVVAIGANGGPTTLTHLLTLLKTVGNNNAEVGSLGYVTNPNARHSLKNTSLDTGSGNQIWDLNSSDKLLGYPAGVTKAVPSNLVKGSSGAVCSAVIFGNWQDLLLLNWGPTDILLDLYTSAKSGLAELVINSYWEVAVANALSFACIKDATTP